MLEIIYAIIGAIIITILVYLDNKLFDTIRKNKHKWFYIRLFIISFGIIWLVFFILNKKDELKNLVGGNSSNMRIDLDDINTGLPKF